MECTSPGDTAQGQRAVRLARAGYAVFPITPGGKVPLLKGGHLDATRDLSVIRQWWLAFPGAEVGVCPGSSSPPFLVLDVDLHGADGFATLAAVDPDLALSVELYGPAQHTPSGGAHLFFAVDDPQDWPNSAGRLGPGLDTRCGNGYIRVYTDELPDLTRLPAAPKWTEAAKGRQAPRQAAEEGTDDPARVRDATAFLASRLPAIEGQGGDAHTFATACQLRNFGLTPETALELLLEWNERCTPPWSEDELAVKVANAFAYSQEKARVDTRFDLGPLLERVKAEAPAAAPPPRRHAIAWGNDILKTPRPDWLINKLLPVGSLAMIFGEYGHYKSFFALDMAVGIASGKSTLGHADFRVAGKGRRVLYLAGEGHFGVRVRYEGYLKARQLADCPNFGLGGWVPNFMTGDAGEEFKELVGQVDVVVIDTWARATAGGNENDNGAMGAAVAYLDALRDNRPEGRPLTIIVVHHAGKGDSGPRGATALPGACDTIFRCQKLGEGQLAVSVYKQKDFAAVSGRIMATGSKVDVSGHPDGTLVFTATGIDEKKYESVDAVVKEEKRRATVSEAIKERDAKAIIAKNIQVAVAKWNGKPLLKSHLARSAAEYENYQDGMIPPSLLARYNRALNEQLHGQVPVEPGGPMQLRDFPGVLWHGNRFYKSGLANLDTS